MCKKTPNLQGSSLQPRKRRKRYSVPQVKTWGTLQDLTHGPGAGPEDFPAFGGSEGV